MGGLATAAQVGLTAVNLINAKQSRKQQLQYDNTRQQIKNQNRKNLLEEQLASRRAFLGATGASSGKSALAVQKKLIDDAYNEIGQENKLSEQKRKMEEDEYKRDFGSSLLGSVVTSSSKLIK